MLPSDLNVTTGYLSSIDGQGALSPGDAKDMVVQVVRGNRLSIHTVTNTLYKPNGDINFSKVDVNGNNTWKLWDATGSAPAVVLAPPRSPDFDPPLYHASDYGVGGTTSDDGFYWKHFNRRTMVYLGTNGGVMHAFDAETGNEVYGYIPDDVMGLQSGEVTGSRDLLKDFVELVVAENNGIVNHKFLLSAPATSKEAFFRGDRGGDDDWHTVLTFGRNAGGRFITALDVTDAGMPVLRFNEGNREGISQGLLDGLGETWSTAVLGNVQTDSGGDPDRPTSGWSGRAAATAV